MASAHSVQNGDFSDDRSFELLSSVDYDNFGEPKILPPILADSSGASGDFGEPDVHPRIGDAYQVDIPPLIEDSNNISYSGNCINLENREYHNTLIGLPIPLTWIGPMKFDKLDSLTSPRNISECSHVVKSETFSEDQAQNHLVSTNEFSHDLGKPLGEQKENMHKCRSEAYSLVPGLDSEYWSGDEKASFLLGLYIFEKNFVEVRRFIETKDMGTVLSFYYGRFYGSRDYIRWSECRKTKSKKCVYGQRIFTGLRQQELLSRLIPSVSEECQNALLEVSKSFTDEKMSLVDYVSSFKAMVGMNILVKAVGIGTGKQDLTGMALEPSKSNQVIPLRIEIPTGKACSSLTTAEIVKFLSGDYRLSKARSNDLFWEAVWPRLLARGWHSEQPMNQAYVSGSKHYLVFLVPGIKKFSRRKLLKGGQYFDSITDVLNKVAKEPGIIELDIEESDGKKNEEEYKWTSERKLEQDEGYNLPTRQRHFYLQPRIRNRKADAMKFTVVDTSLCGGIIRELRSLPSEISNSPTSQDLPGDSDEDISVDITEESDIVNTISKPDRKMLKGVIDHDVDASYPVTHTVYPDYSYKTLRNSKSKKDLLEKKQPRKALKSHLSQHLKNASEDFEAPIAKRCRRLPVCSHEEASDSVIRSWTAPGLENGMSSSCADAHESTKSNFSRVDLCHDKFSSTVSSKGSPSDSVEFNRALIDLNLPQTTPDSENDVFTTETSEKRENQTSKIDDHCLPNPPSFEPKPEQHQSDASHRRYSTRNRPPTTRALEALANGYLTVNRRRKFKDVSSCKDLGFRPLQPARVVVRPNESSNNTPVASQVQETDNGPSNRDIFCDSQVLPEENDGSGYCSAT